MLKTSSNNRSSLRFAARVASLALATSGLFFVATGSAQAASRDGVCDPGEFCYYYNSAQQGALSDFTGSVADYGSAQPGCFEFKGVGSGSGRCLKNNAASVWNRTSRYVTVFYNRDYTGGSQVVPAGSKVNLNSALKNENASHRLSTTAPSRTLPSKLTFSASGASFIATYEGFEATPDEDPTGNCTVGYGHKIHNGTCTSADRRTWGTMTRSRGLTLLRKDANSFASGIRVSIPKTPLKQSEFDALISFSYNIGLGGFKNSKVREDVVASPPLYGSVPGHMRNWASAGGRKICGLYKRRVNEGELFSRGDYTINTVRCPSAFEASVPGALSAGPSSGVRISASE